MLLRLVQLRKYKRLMLKNIQHFEWTPTKNLMVIIGSNGSGKSSVLDELSPLPSHKSQFEEGGGKTVHCTHNGSTYVMESVYDRGTGHHTFIKDGVKLNDNGTYQMQLNFCAQEFNDLDDNLQDIITGRTKFSQLPVNKRREWLTRMSPVNLGYAFQLLQRVNEQAKAQKNIIDHMSKRLVNENIDILSDSEVTRLSQERQRLTDRVNTLFMYRRPGHKQQFRGIAGAESELNAVLHDAKILVKRYPRLNDDIRVANAGEYNRNVNARLATMQASQAVIDHMIEELETIRSTTPNQIEKISPEEIAELKERLRYHLEEARVAKNTVVAYDGNVPLCDVGVFGDQHAKVEDAFDRAYGIVMTIPDNEDGGLSTDIAQRKREQLTELKTKLRSVEEFISTTMRRIATLKGCDHVQCPNCSHTFVPGVDPLDIPKLEAKLKSAGEAEQRITTELHAVEEYLERFTDYAGYVQQFQQLTRDHRDYQSVWEWMVFGSRLFRSPRLIATEIVKWHSAQKAVIECQNQLEHAKVLTSRLKVIEAIDFDAAGYMMTKAADMEKTIGEKLLTQQATRDAIEEYVRSGREIEQYVEDVNKLLSQYELWKSRAIEQAEWLLDQAFEQEIDATHGRLAIVGNQLREAERRDTEIKLIEETVADSSDAHADLQLLAKALSPKGGLIGQYLLGFLQGVTQLVNTVIDEVWTYPMEVLPSKMDRDDLDYKFPLKVSDGAVVAADIDLGSDSQKEIVNFAFRIAMLKFLGFDEWPLMLDEFGRTFDEQHRANLIPFISRLIELNAFSQIFFISHFESTHGAFNQAEVMVLDPTNVTVPEHYNKNVVIA